ncbi:Trypsin domain containing protein [Asbolus verrucosus]|uniref:Phenoloxidase-activating factor 2 n=1 Tax=Asbolus verrucosus TaxID=1661398 RepID=A0A482W4U3_ASBVE|nr:Trypsin domain containing protein [Asbolus verrucosus]
MRIILIATLISLAFANERRDDDFFSNFEEVTSPPPESLGAVPKCGEEEQKDKFMCVPYFNCDPSSNTIVDNPIVDGSNTIRPRTRPFECDHYLQICCRIPNGTTLPLELVPTINLDFQLECGIKKSETVNSSENSHEANFGEFPWMVAILNSSKETDSILICGGSLISPVVVLTAAHCVRDLKPQEIKIRAGEWNIQTINEKISHQEKEVSKIIVHKYHLRSTLYNDIALLILNSSLSKVENIGSICLPSSREDYDPTDCFVTGWGNVHGQEYFSNILKKIPLSLVSNNDCQNALRTKLGNEFILDHSFICAEGESGADACSGDGGGPLICSDSSNRNRFYQVGIVSWGVGCEEDLIPGVYTNVTEFKNWIEVKLRELGYNSTTFTP